MKIISIEKYKGKSYRLILDNDEHIYINADVLAEFGFREDTDYSMEEIEEAVYANLKRKAKQRALYLISYRDHSYMELYEKLKKTYKEQIATEISDKMVDLGFIDDEKYARRLIQNYWNTKRFGMRRIKFELSKKGIDKHLIEDLLYEIDPDEAQDKIREVIEKKYYRNLDDEKGVQKVISALARMGHNYSDIRAVIRELTDDEYRYY